MQAILSFKWGVQDEDAREACSQLFRNLISVHADFLVPVLRVLVTHLNSGLEGVIDSSDATESNELDSKSNLDSKVVAMMHQALHSTLEAILKQRPTAATALIHILIKLFPHHRCMSPLP